MTRLAVWRADGTTKEVLYDVERNEFYDDRGQMMRPRGEVSEASPSVPHVRVLFGAMCNFSCSYCHQHATMNGCDYTLDVDKVAVHIPKDEPSTWSAWGGEALLRFEDIVVLDERLKTLRPLTRFGGTATNGQLLKEDRITDFFLRNKYPLMFSYDGPGQDLRGVNPLADESCAKNIDKLLGAGLLHFSPVFTRLNRSLRTYILYCQQFLKKPVRLQGACTLQAVNKVSYDAAIPEEDLDDFATQLCQDAYVQYESYQVYSAVERFVSRIGQPHNFRCSAVFGNRKTVTASGERIVCHNFNIPYDGYRHENAVLKDKCRQCPVVSFCYCQCPMDRGGEYEEYNCKAQYAFNFHMLALSFYRAFGHNIARVIG